MNLEGTQTFSPYHIVFPKDPNMNPSIPLGTADNVQEMKRMKKLVELPYGCIVNNIWIIIK